MSSIFFLFTAFCLLLYTAGDVPSKTEDIPVPIQMWSVSWMIMGDLMGNIDQKLTTLLGI